MNPNTIARDSCVTLTLTLEAVICLVVFSIHVYGADVSDNSPKQRAAHPFLLVPQRVFGTADELVHENWAVLVNGRKIAKVGPRTEMEPPPDAIMMELPQMTLLPGLMDIHSHIFLHPYNEALWNDQVLKEPLAYRSVEAVIHVKDTLLAGFTLLRDLGTEGAGFSDLSIKRAIEEGLIPGPRLQVATKAIVATASYGPGPLGFAENVLLPKGAQEASGLAEVVKAVREQVGAGADWIKVYADYGRGPGGKQAPTFSVEELRAMVEEAHSAERPTARAIGDVGGGRSDLGARIRALQNALPGGAADRTGAEAMATEGSASGTPCHRAHRRPRLPRRRFLPALAWEAPGAETHPAITTVVA